MPSIEGSGETISGNINGDVGVLVILKFYVVTKCTQLYQRPLACKYDRSECLSTEFVQPV